MKDIKKIVSILFFLSLCFVGISQYNSRLESEYKLSVDKKDVDSLWFYLKATFNRKKVIFGNFKLNGIVEEETFIDQYFDDNETRLLNKNIGIRHRLRIIDGKIIKRLIQVKFPSEDQKGVIRKEIKFEISKNSTRFNLLSRHPLLKYLTETDREYLDFYLTGYDVDIYKLEPSIKLRQIRKRIYLSDEKGSVATITLDQVRNCHLPFQKYTELELELNEIRYTQADSKMKLNLDTLNLKLRANIINSFPKLKQDQTPKYNKMFKLVSGNNLSFLFENFMWIVFGSIVALASYRAILWR